MAGSRKNGLKEYYALILVAGCFLILIAEVVFRYLLGGSLEWTDEISRILLVWMTFTGMGFVIRDKKEIVCEAFGQKLPSRVQRVLVSGARYPRGGFCPLSVHLRNQDDPVLVGDQDRESRTSLQSFLYLHPRGVHPDALLPWKANQREGVEGREERDMIGTILFVLLILFIVCQIPIAVAMGLSAVVYFLYAGVSFGTFVQQTLSGADSFVLMAIPLFMFSGELMNDGA